MTERIMIAGSGGQGIMLVGKILAEAVMMEGKFITWLPSYGAEVRGGTAHCMVTISDGEISSPYVDKADSVVIMNLPSFERFKSRLVHNGLLIINSSFVAPAGARNIHALYRPFTEIAIRLGNIKVANMVALGCLIAQKNMVRIESVLRVISAIAPKEKRHLVEINKKALREGVSLR